MSEERNEGGRTGGVDRPRVTRVSSRELLCGASKLIIDHEGEMYHLTLTRSGKLILTK